MHPSGMKGRVFDVARESLHILPSLKSWLQDIPVSSIEQSTKDFECYIPDLEDDVRVCKGNAVNLLKHSMYWFIVLKKNKRTPLTEF